MLRWSYLFTFSLSQVVFKIYLPVFLLMSNSAKAITNMLVY